MRHLVILGVLISISSLSVIAGNTLPLSSVDEIKAACAAHENGRAFNLTGQIIIPPLSSRRPTWIYANGSVLMLYDLRTNRNNRVTVGDIVRLRGLCESASQLPATNPNFYTLDVLSPGILPPVPPASVTDLVFRHKANTRVAIRGVIKDIEEDDIDPRFLYILLSDGTNTVALSYVGPKEKAPTFRLLLETEVVAEGILASPHSSPRTYLYRLVNIAGPESIRVVHGVRQDRFDVPPFDFTRETTPDEISTSGRHRIEGTVRACWNGNSILVQTPTSAVVAKLAVLPPPLVGTHVEIVGNPETDLFDISLTRAFWRRSNRQPMPEPMPEQRTIKSIFQDRLGLPQNYTAAHGHILRLPGTVAETLLDANGIRSILLTDDNYSLPVRCDAIPDIFDFVRKGCRIEVTGVAIKDSDAWSPSASFPRIRGLFLVPRTVSDVRILAQPPWWTPLKFVFCVVLLFSGLLAVLIWNASLRILVVRKSRTLLREQAERLTETLKASERTRLAADLHDYHSQNLTAIAYQVARARRFWKEKKDETGTVLETVTRMLKSCRSDLRNCLWDLRSDTLDEPNFAEAIRRTVVTVAGTARLVIRFEGSRARMSDPTAHAVLSILRELVANAANHGHANEIHIAGECRLGMLRFSVRDDGCGFDPVNCPDTTDGHFGLSNIRERLRQLGGSLDIDSHRGIGTYVRLTIIHSTENTRQ